MKPRFSLPWAALFLLATGVTFADDLAKNFATPPPSSRPWVYWFPLDGNISREGITADLEAMQRAGIGGVLYMETDQGAPQGPAQFAGPLWRELFKHICSEASRLGLQVNMNNDAGWCGSGGPWITPELSMQRIVWTETEVTGPQPFNGTLAHPQATKDFYRDIAVFAYPKPPKNTVIPHLRGKSAETREEIPLRSAFPALAADSLILRDRIVNLTDKLRPGGGLTWDVPAGSWTLLRMGHTTTGKDNHPAPLAGRGLECDKLSKDAAEVHFNALMGKLIADNQSLVGEQRTLVSTHIDSWEVGSQNWTPKFREEFQRLRGYDPLPLLPVVSGRVVDSIEVSERFLWDVRQTVNDLLCENYAGHFRSLAHRHGLRLSIEAYDTPPCDDLTYAGRADEPMAEFWSWGIGDSPWFAAYSCTEMASSAHVYGRPILGAEAFTATNLEKWQGHPAVVKPLGDWAFCEGVNRFVFHRYALQPWTNPDRPPGMSMGPWGLHYERTQTWWEMSRAWHEYLARCQYLLQQGRFVADLCFLTPESSPQRAKSPVKSGFERPGYNFDLCPPEVVLTRMSVQDGRLVLPDDMSYRMLVLPQVETMTPGLLRKIRDLVQGGATIVGTPPRRSPSLQDYPRCDEEIRTLATELWGNLRAKGPQERRPFGKGQVIWPKDLQPKPDPAYDCVSAFSSAKWIWFPEGNPARSAPPGKRFFRRSVTVDGPVQSARWIVSADNTFEAFVNGQSAGKGENFHQGTSMTLTSLLKPGQNTFTVSAVNTLDTPNPAGLVGAVEILYAGGRRVEIRTDAAWESAQTPDGAWKPATELGPVGMSPWGDVVESPEAVDPIPDIAIPSRLLAEAKLPPDFQSSPPLRYIHKQLDQADFYFVANPEPKEVAARCTFRVAGKLPELWRPDSGQTELPGNYQWENGCVTLPLRLDPSGSLFVVFRQKGEESLTGRKDGPVNWPSFRKLCEITGPWKVAFDPKWGGPAEPVLWPQLRDWSQTAEWRICDYSGTAVYRTSFQVSEVKTQTCLDLGKVAVMAEVRVNGQAAGILWKPPFRADVTSLLRPGENSLEVRVANLWINRMIADEQLPEDSDRNPSGNLKQWPSWLLAGQPSPTGRLTFTSWRLWKKEDARVESGLIGPVTLQWAEQARGAPPSAK